ncbi:MAG: hypothetical protein AAB731_02730 [Patescibacteria group bacterium]
MRTITVRSRLVLLATSICLDEKNLRRHPTFTLHDLLMGKKIACWGNGAARIVEFKEDMIEDTVIAAKDNAPFVAKSMSYCRLEYWLGIYGLELQTDTVASA